MRSYIYLLLALVLLSGSVSGQAVAQKQPSEAAKLNGKDFLVNYYQRTLEALRKSTESLTADQLRFKPAADKWSIGECLEHIVSTEKALFEYAKQGMNKPATPERRAEVKATDEDIIKGINDRSFKAKATDDLTGKNQVSNAGNLIATLQNDRNVIMGYLAGVKEEDLRNHISDSPFGAIDAFQSFLFIAGHTSRHTLQIEEVKASQNFPKK